MEENLLIELANKILAEGVVDSSWNLHNLNYFCLSLISNIIYSITVQSLYLFNNIISFT